MGNSSIKVSENREYLESDRWKCKKSPSGAHHWIISGQQMICKYCDSCKQINASGSGWPKPEAK
jgi:hypothetical protein